MGHVLTRSGANLEPQPGFQLDAEDISTRFQHFPTLVMAMTRVLSHS